MERICEMANDAYTSAKIDEIRAEKGISEMDMATGIGTPLTLYRVFVKTPSKFDAAMLEKAAGVLGVSVAELTGEE